MALEHIYSFNFICFAAAVGLQKKKHEERKRCIKTGEMTVKLQPITQSASGA